MNYNKIVQGILDIGEAMLQSGAENFRLEDSFYRMCRSYGFKRSDVFVIPSNIQVTVETPEGEIITQIRHIESSEPNFDQLDYLNNLSRFICKNKPDAPELQAKLQEVMNRPEQPRWQHYIAGVMGGAGFAVFFNTNFMDTIVAVLASLIIVALGEVLGKYEHNPLIFNAIIACVVETFIILAVTFGLGDHVNYITIGVVMLLISGIGFTNGIRDLLHRDTLSGIVNIWNSVLGATGIALGIALPILLLKGVL